MPDPKKATHRELQKIIGYRFRDSDLLEQALIHRSFLNESRQEKLEDNERFEFLGDAVLQLAISDYLIEHFPRLHEGDLSKKRSALVREESLAGAAENLKIGRHLILGRGEEASGGRHKPSILASALEAVIGAVYLDGGYPAAAAIIEVWLERFLKAASGEEIFQSDYKSRLQELCQSRYRQSPEYVVISESGPDHRKSFKVGVRLRGELRGFGKGNSKKEAEQSAARDAILGMETSAAGGKA